MRLFFFIPRYKYWVGIYRGRLIVERSRFNPVETFMGNIIILLDGPFLSQEEAVRSLHFWSHQYEVLQCH